MARKAVEGAAAVATPNSRTTAGRVAKQKATNPLVRFKYMRANSGVRMTRLSATMSEKMTYMKADIRRSLANLRHPINPVYKTAAKERARETKVFGSFLCAERKRQKVAAAENIAAQKRAAIRERRARELHRSVY